MHFQKTLTRESDGPGHRQQITPTNGGVPGGVPEKTEAQRADALFASIMARKEAPFDRGNNCRGRIHLITLTTFVKSEGRFSDDTLIDQLRAHKVSQREYEAAGRRYFLAEYNLSWDALSHLTEAKFGAVDGAIQTLNQARKVVSSASGNGNGRNARRNGQRGGI